MTIQEQLRVAKATRKMLEVCYIPGTLANGVGGHCHVGALGMIVCGNAFSGFFEGMDLLQRLDRTAERIYVKAGRYIHHDHASIYVNNVLGKDAILAVYDDVIAQLEVAVLCEQESSKQTAAELEFAK